MVGSTKIEGSPFDHGNYFFLEEPMSQGLEDSEKRWTREEVEKTLKDILVDALGVEEDRVVPDASLISDLGAESIDFLDLSFRSQQTFGVELPNKAIQDKVLSWRNMAALNRILEERYGAGLAADEIKQFNTKGIPDLLRWFADERKIKIENGEAEEVAAELTDRMAGEVESIGFKTSLIDREGIKRLLLENFNSPKIMEGMLRVLSVGAMVDFISDRVDTKGRS
jgi:acyl carrier protein